MRRARKRTLTRYHCQNKVLVFVGENRPSGPASQPHLGALSVLESPAIASDPHRFLANPKQFSIDEGVCS